MATALLHEAILGGDLAAVRQHLADHPEAANTAVDGALPLHTALDMVAGKHPAHLDIARLLLPRSDLINARNAQGVTALHLNSITGDAAMAEVLLAAGADPNARNPQDGSTPLHLAAMFGTEAVVGFLVDHGADIDSRETKYGVTPLHIAAVQGHLGTVRLLLAKGASPTVKDNDGQTAAELARRQNRPEAVRLIREHQEAAAPTRQAELDAQLFAAVEANDAEQVRAALELGARTDATGPDGNTPLHLAAAGKRVACCAALLAAGADRQALNDRGQTPLAQVEESEARLARAVHQFAAGSLDRLVAQNIESELRELRRVFETTTPAAAEASPAPAAAGSPAPAAVAFQPMLLWSLALNAMVLTVCAAIPYLSRLAHAGAPGGVDLDRPATLLVAGVGLLGVMALSARAARAWTRWPRLSVGARLAYLLAPLALGIGVGCAFPVNVDVNGLSARLAQAVDKDDLPAVELLLARHTFGKCSDPVGRAQAALPRALAGGHVKVAELLLTVGRVDVNAIAASDLLAVASRGHDGVITMLLDRGATAEAKGAMLCGAAAAGNAALAKRLLDQGADVNARNQFPLFWAVKSAEASVQVIGLLLDRGAEVNAKADGGTTPLHLAARTGRADVVRLLLSKGADANAKDNSGETPLGGLAEGTALAKDGYPEVVQLLLSSGADANTKDRAGNSVLYLAARWGRPDMVRALLKGGADPNAKASDGDTPLCTAVRYGGQLVQLLLDNGADVNARDHEGKTPLSRTPDAKVVALLKAHGASE